jgi:hypothetical protein
VGYRRAATVAGKGVRAGGTPNPSSVGTIRFKLVSLSKYNNYIFVLRGWLCFLAVQPPYSRKTAAQEAD